MPKREWKFLAPNPKSSYRQHFVQGTRIRAEVLYGLTVDGDEKDRLTAEQVAAEYGLPLDAVREAIAYCAADPPEVREDHARRGADGGDGHERSGLQVRREVQVTERSGIAPAASPMNLYLDDDTAAALFIRLLRGAGHDVRTPAELGLVGVDDPVHLAQAIRERRSLMSRYAIGAALEW